MTSMSGYRDLSPDELAVLAGAAVAVAACVARPLWRSARLVVTATHELGHVLAALLLGGNVSRVHLWADTAGLTSYSLPARGHRRRHGVVALAGYPAPGIAGLAGAWFVVAGWERWWVALAALVTVVLAALWVRNPWGVFSTIAAAGGLGWVALAGPPWLVTSVASGLAVLLLAGGWRSAAAHLSGRERHGRGAATSDAAAAARVLYVPAGLWSALFVGSATATLLAGGWLLAAAVR
jgi:peptidase M50B-like protein